jgi:penicillin-binding protein 1B
MLARLPRVRRFLLYAAIAVPLAAGGYGLWVWHRITSEFDAREWRVPAQVYAAPLELYAGRRLAAGTIVEELQRLGYGPVAGAVGTGYFRRSGNAIDVGRRAFDYDGAHVAAETLHIELRGGRIAKVEDGRGRALGAAQLEPMLIGSVFPTRAEDRLIVGPDEVPELLTESLKAVADRPFDTHLCIDARAMLRAAIANVRGGGISQGGSTLTMQLVRSFFLSNRQTYTRKIREALMSLVLELVHSKDEILLAYVNEIYLGQDGARAVHGFGLASRFYFGKPLNDLDVHEIALLVAIVRGPSYYDPRRNPERALARRTLVLEQMRDAGIIDDAQLARSRDRGLGVITTRKRRTAYYPQFMDLVHRQLRGEYTEKDLEKGGLKVYSTLDPLVQAEAEQALADELERLQGKRAELEGAVIVTSPQSGEVRALVGGKRVGFDGFNRALDAHRQVGSLIKPVVYLAALESGRYTLARQLPDEPITVDLGNGQTWSPKNFDGEVHGDVTAVRALAESLNLATVHLGLEVGPGRVARLLERLGAERPSPVYPSLLLGAIELTPYQVTQVYNTIANGGFRAPLRAVRAVVDAQGNTVQRYALALEQAADPAAVYALNQGLVQVMRRGTGTTAQRLLPADLVTAGKTGTSDDLRDSWFAGFSNDYLAVVWVGNDDNENVGLTGGTGAAQVWARVLGSLDTAPYALRPPEGAQALWIDYNTGLATDERCPNAVYLAMTSRDVPPKAVTCGSTRTRAGGRLLEWLRNKLRDELLD